MTKLQKIMKNQDVKKTTKIEIAETVIFPTVTYGRESWTVKKKGKEKKLCLLAMDVEQNSTSSVDREENKFFSFGGSETQKIIRSNNPPIKAMLFLCLDKSQDTGGRENHGCDGLTVSRRPLAYGWML